MAESREAVTPWQRWRPVVFYQVFAVWIWLRTFAIFGEPPAWGGVTFALIVQAFAIAMAIKVIRTGRL
jgi:hypothetical protein